MSKVSNILSGHKENNPVMVYKKSFVSFFSSALCLVLMTGTAVAAACEAHPVAIRGTSLAPLVQSGTTMDMIPAECAGNLHKGDFAVFTMVLRNGRLLR